MKSIPRELAVTMADDPCIPIDGLFVYIDVKQKMQVQEKEEESLKY
jgi:hypothetical protein